jgi:hypothetical protein
MQAVSRMKHPIGIASCDCRMKSRKVFRCILLEKLHDLLQQLVVAPHAAQSSRQITYSQVRIHVVNVPLLSEFGPATAGIVMLSPVLKPRQIQACPTTNYEPTQSSSTTAVIPGICRQHCTNTCRV